MRISKGKYDDIINLPHHVSKKYPQMSLENRSAQFAPFAALKGYEEEIKETARINEVSDEGKCDFKDRSIDYELFYMI